MTQWQPIETAPLDGTWVLICGGQTDEDDYMDEGVLVQRPVVAFFDPEKVDWSTEDHQEGCWLFCFWDGSWRTGYDNPTHWMTLPEAPK